MSDNLDNRWGLDQVVGQSALEAKSEGVHTGCTIGKLFDRPVEPPAQTPKERSRDVR